MKLNLNTLLFFMLATALIIGPSGYAQAANPNDLPYIIVFKDTVNPAVEAPGLAKVYELQTGFIYQHALKGMSAVIPAGRLEALKHDPARGLRGGRFGPHD